MENEYEESKIVNPVSIISSDDIPSLEKAFFKEIALDLHCNIRDLDDEVVIATENKVA